jgi:hypothetical protein
MLPENDKNYLQSNLLRNRVVLFLGAGFSGEAQNEGGDQIPKSRALAGGLWNFLEYAGDYDGTELRYIYDAARKKRGDAAVREFLRSLLTVTKYPDWYKLTTGWYWRRVYTTNIDNLIEAVFAGASGVPALEVVVPPDEFTDRDAFLRGIQYIKLHGSANELTKPIVFSPIEYGRRASLHDVWYDHFLRDYSTYPTILIGTELNEPLFWQYLAARQEKPRGAAESRPKSFLVSPNISKARVEALSLYNIEPISATAEEFLTWLAQLPEFRAGREAVLREVDPTLEEILTLEKAGEPRASIRAAEVFFTTFEQLKPLSRNPSARRDFLLGVQPSWSDIGRNLDADREVNKQLKDLLRAEYSNADGQVPIVVLHGSAGSGKTTTAMRVAYTLALEGMPVYFATGNVRPDPRLICAYLRDLNVRTLLVFDNGAPDLRLIVDLKIAAEDLPHKSVILITLRSNQWFQKRYFFHDCARLADVEIPNLGSYDIKQILTVLEREGLLGALQALKPEERFQIFNEKARKQILVAMREATKGEPFNEILRDEFNSIAPEDARLLFLIAAIPSMYQYHIGQDEAVAAMELPPAETGVLLRQALSGIILPHPQRTDRFAVRHPLIAEFVVTEVAPPESLAEAYIRYLQVIAHELNSGREGRTSRVSKMFGDLINHENLHSSFPRHPGLCRKIYDAVRDHYGHNGHFWLQYGVYELKFGHLDLAENYLLQAQGLIPQSEPLSTAFGHLYMRKAIETNLPAVALEQRAEGEKILRAQIGRIGMRDPYPYHVLGSQSLGYINKWIPQDDKPEELRRLYAEIKPGVDRHSLASHLRALLADIKKAELETALKR